MTEGLKEVRCKNEDCRKLLFKVPENKPYQVEIVCSRCKALATYSSTPPPKPYNPVTEYK